MEKRVEKKKAQVAVFIILAVMLVAAGGIAFLITKDGALNKKFSEDSQIQAQYDLLTSQIYSCLTNTYQDSLEVVGFQGGYYNKPVNSYDFGWGFVPYYYDEGKFLMPNNEDIQNEINSAVDENLVYCLDEIERSNFEVTYSKSKTRSEIRPESVYFKTDLPIKISQGKNTATIQLKDHSLNIPSKLYDMMEIANFIYQSHKEDPYMISFSTLVDMGTEKDLWIDLRDFDNSSTIYVISYNQTSDSYPSIFEFLARYKQRDPVSLISPTL